MSDFLQEAAEASQQRVRGAQANRSRADLVASQPRAPHRVECGAFTLIAEVKRVSPAEGTLGDTIDPVSQAVGYAEGGANAVSVLTEPERFGGSLTDLQQVADAVPCPAMRKDFLVDDYQVYEGVAAGASMVLIIVAIGTKRHHAMIDAAAQTGCAVLIEAFDENEYNGAQHLAEYADTVGVTSLLGINCRNLETLQVDRERFDQFAPVLSSTRPTIAESGIHTADDIRHVRALGYRGALVGTSLMRADNPSALVRSMADAAVGVQT